MIDVCGENSDKKDDQSANSSFKIIYGINCGRMLNANINIYVSVNWLVTYGTEQFKYFDKSTPVAYDWISVSRRVNVYAFTERTIAEMFN